ncbi:hypothetical protein C8F04DRAFT_1281238 [Mycena alexandri]|uniref:Uncharacterized protein n=1 Tax=Mycena alexandri TaxID=1745969 RepID=A0AAD6RX55_9AGAR|nr:hypothetical protein C8F04DRAFT_1281238 [Mycena alexandri]
MLPVLCFFLSGYPPPPARPSPHLPWYPSRSTLLPPFFQPVPRCYSAISVLRHWYKTSLPALSVGTPPSRAHFSASPRPSEPPPHIYRGTPPAQRCYPPFLSARSPADQRYVIALSLLLPLSVSLHRPPVLVLRCYPALPTLRPSSTVVPLPFDAGTPLFSARSAHQRLTSLVRNFFCRSLCWYTALRCWHTALYPALSRWYLALSAVLSPSSPAVTAACHPPGPPSPRSLLLPFPTTTSSLRPPPAPVSAAGVPPTALLSRFPPSRASDDIKPAAAPPPSSRLVATCVPGTLCRHYPPLLVSRLLCSLCLSHRRPRSDLRRASPSLTHQPALCLRFPPASVPLGVPAASLVPAAAASARALRPPLAPPRSSHASHATHSRRADFNVVCATLVTVPLRAVAAVGHGRGASFDVSAACTSPSTPRVLGWDVPSPLPSFPLPLVPRDLSYWLHKGAHWPHAAAAQSAALSGVVTAWSARRAVGN